MKKVAALTIVLALAGYTARSAAAQAPSMEFMNGACDESSHTAEGPLGADLSKRRSRFYCDSAVIAFLTDYKNHVMIQFAQHQSHHDPILGFAGTLAPDGINMTVDHVYLVAGQSTTVSEGYCKFYFEGRHPSGIFCGMKVDETGRRTTAIVGFKAAPGQ